MIFCAAFGAASPIARPSAAFTCRRPKFRKNICALSIRIAMFIIFKSPALAARRPRKSRDLWAFANWFSSSSSMMSHFSLSSGLVYTKLGPKSFWVATAPFDARRPGLRHPNHVGSSWGIGPWTAKSAEEQHCRPSQLTRGECMHIQRA